MPEVNVPVIPGQVSAVAAGVNPPQPVGMKVSDVLNMARTAQEYQKAKELLPYEIEAGKAQSRQQQLSAEKAGVDLNQHYANISRGVMGGFLSDPDFINGNPEQMVKKMTLAHDYMLATGVKEADGGKSFEHMIQLAKQDPAQAYQLIKNGIQQGGGVANQYQTIQPQQAPALYQGGAPVQPAPTGAPTGVTPGQMSQPYGAQTTGLELPYPVRKAGQPYAPAPSEAQDFAQGQAYRDSIVKRAVEIPQSQFNVQQVISKAKELEKTYGKAAESTLVGGLTRKVAGAVGETEFRELSKDLAIAQLSNMKALGLDLGTDQGRQLVSAASGDITFPPSVLIKIARRVEADNTNIEMQAQAAQKFSTRFGDNNMKAFQQAWAKNASPEVFQAINVYRDANLNADEKKAMIDKIMGGDESKRKQFYQQYQNINKLVNTGGL